MNESLGASKVFVIRYNCDSTGADYTVAVCKSLEIAYETTKQWITVTWKELGWDIEQIYFAEADIAARHTKYVGKVWQVMAATSSIKDDTGIGHSEMVEIREYELL